MEDRQPQRRDDRRARADLPRLPRARDLPVASARDVPGSVIHEVPPPLGSGTAEDPRLVVETWLAVPATEGWRVLLLRRAPGHGGFWQGVSGRVEAGDATLAEAALREIREETGIAAGVTVFDLGRWIEFRGFTGTVYRKRSLGAVLPLGTVAASIALSEEHDRVALVTFEEARSRIRWPENAEELVALERALAEAARPTDPA